MKSDLCGKKVLVTGGAGRIGVRLVEKLVSEIKADVRVLVRNFGSTYRIARLPIEIMCGDVTQISDVSRAVNECEVVFHCAYGNQGDKKQRRLVNVEGTRIVLEAALNAGVRRVVHISTVAVYGWTRPDGDLDETAPRRYSSEVYSDSKLDAEKIAFQYWEKHHLPVVVIQPTEIYGPFLSPWTIAVLQQLRTGKVILVNGGDGLCNPVYIDDLISAILQAAVKEQAVGEAFLISGEQPVTWKEFYGKYEQMLGISSTVSMSKAEAKAYREKAKSIVTESLSIFREDLDLRQRILRTREAVYLKWLGNAVLPNQLLYSLKKRVVGRETNYMPNTVPHVDKPIHPLAAFLVQYFSTKTRIRIDKAKRLLGYQPVFDFETGMKLTGEWAKWANLLD